MRDYGFLAILFFIAVIVIWLLLMPVVPAITTATMRRFHLRSGSFMRFAAQFPIPAMYNFANRTEVKDFPPGLVDSFFGVLEPDETFRYINHFPARDATFSVGRFWNLKDGRDHWFTLESNYRGQQLRTQFYLKNRGERDYVLLRQQAP
jgi:hypothetical protein